METIEYFSITVEEIKQNKFKLKTGFDINPIRNMYIAIKNKVHARKPQNRIDSAKNFDRVVLMKMQINYNLQVF